MDSRGPSFLFIPVSNDKPKQFPMNHSQHPYAESVFAVHQRYEDTSLIIFNQLQKSLGKLAKAQSAGVPLGGSVLPAQGSQPPRKKPEAGRGGAPDVRPEVTNEDKTPQVPAGNPSAEAGENQSPPQSKVPAFPKQTAV
ncbi:hypothetical protein ElyMa_000544300 [Elysia marginata]|uniref:Uncharacterized protein n=1 Tax=Elysia marginata TaxID=1093978 RepID=A0AAV4G1X2_9GAST|nr:hypothetical protein ElyMa_000544300 [Elysia marginata]